MSERASERSEASSAVQANKWAMQANKLADERMAKYSCPDFMRFWISVEAFFPSCARLGYFSYVPRLCKSRDSEVHASTGAEILRDGVDFFLFSNRQNETIYVDFKQFVPIVWRAVAVEWRLSIAALTFDVHLRQD